MLHFEGFALDCLLVFNGKGLDNHAAVVATCVDESPNKIKMMRFMYYRRAPAAMGDEDDAPPGRRQGHLDFQTNIHI